METSLSLVCSSPLSLSPLSLSPLSLPLPSRFSLFFFEEPINSRVFHQFVLLAKTLQAVANNKTDFKLNNQGLEKKKKENRKKQITHNKNKTIINSILYFSFLPPFPFPRNETIPQHFPSTSPLFCLFFCYSPLHTPPTPLSPLFFLFCSFRSLLKKPHLLYPPSPTFPLFLSSCSLSSFPSLSPLQSCSCCGCCVHLYCRHSNCEYLFSF